MGSSPLAPLSSTERATYRTALTGDVVRAVYSAWQREQTLMLEQIVLDVRHVRPDAPTIEIHRAVAQLEYAGLIAPVGDPAGHWRHVETPVKLPQPIAVCPTPECLRPAGHGEDHLPDLNGDRHIAQLVVPADDFIAAWPPGSPWVSVYATATDWITGSDPVDTIPVPHTTRFVPDSLLNLVAAWTSSDTNPTPGNPSDAKQVYAYHVGVDNGTLIARHGDFCAVWEHDRGEVRFYQDVVAWDWDPEDTIGRVPVTPDVPFTGAVLDQIAEDWFNRQSAREDTEARSH